MKVVASFGYRHEAEHAAGYLRADGIPAIVHADDAGGLHPGLGFTREARLLVSDADLSRAVRTLRDAGILEGQAEEEEE
jgi:hypothetical protein